MLCVTLITGDSSLVYFLSEARKWWARSPVNPAANLAGLGWICKSSSLDFRHAGARAIPSFSLQCVDPFWFGKSWKRPAKIPPPQIP